jgi:hypothetical protein
LPVGTHTISASYAGDGNFSSSSDDLDGGQVVTKSATTAKLARSTSDAAQPLTLTATILALAPGSTQLAKPTGQVTFVIDGVARGTVDLTAGVAGLFLPNGLPQGTHTIVVKYAGDGNFAASNTSFSVLFGGRTV